MNLLPALGSHIPAYTVQQLEQMGGTPVGNGMEYSVTFGALGSSAAGLTGSDLNLLSNATGAQLSTGPQGIQMTVRYNGAPISAQDLSNALAAVEESNTNKNLTLADMQEMAKSQAQFTQIQTFANDLAALRQSIGPNQSISPLTIINLAKQASASGSPIPESFVANAIGYLNGLSLG